MNQGQQQISPNDHQQQNDNQGQNNGQYQNTAIPENEIIHIHMVCHSHQDVGWLMTPENYYNYKVKQIITSVVKVLITDTTKKFSQTEIYYFEKWYHEQDEATRKQVKQLISEGRLEFINGGWVSNDEACPTYEEIIINFMTGHSFLMKEFGISTKIAWHPDSFGHSAATPDLMLDLGMEAIFFARVDEELKNYFKNNQSLEFYWKPKLQGPNGQYQNQRGLFTHVMHQGYDGGCGFNILTDLDNEAYLQSSNKRLIQEFKVQMHQYITCIEQYAVHYKTKHILFTLGTDFAFQFAHTTYKYIDELVSLFEKSPSGKAFSFKYSTVREYLDAIVLEQKTQDFEWPVYEYDFFPYNGNFQSHYWTGFYSSRPNFKQLIRYTSTQTFLSNQIYVVNYFLESKSDTDRINTQKSMTQARLINQQLATLMHHDTITGTSPQRIIIEEQLSLSLRLSDNSYILVQIIKSLVQLGSGILIDDLMHCLYYIDQRKICPAQMIKEDLLYFVVYNPSLQIQDHIHLTRGNSNFNAFVFGENHNMEPVESEKFCYSNEDFFKECDIYIYQEVYPFRYALIMLQKAPDTNNEIEGLGFGDYEPIFNETMLEEEGDSVGYNYSDQCDPKILFIQNKIIRLEVIKCTEHAIQFNYIRFQDDIEHKFEFEFRYYLPVFNGRKKNSGLYVFKTEDQDSRPYDHRLTGIEAFRGELVERIIINFKQLNGEISQIKISLDNDETDELEFDVFMARIDRKEFSKGKEVTINWRSIDIDNQGIFYTDANSYKIVKRDIERDTYRSYLSAETKLSSPQKYFYPVTSGMFIEDVQQKNFMVVMNDRCQGGSVYKQGRLEYLLNRYGVTTDELGLNEGMNDLTSDYTGPNITAQFWLSFPVNKEQVFRKIFMRHALNQNMPIILYSKIFTTLYRLKDNEGFDINHKISHKFRAMVNKYEILDAKIIPDENMRDFFFRVTRFSQSIKLPKDFVDQMFMQATGQQFVQLKHIRQVKLAGELIFDKYEQQDTPYLAVELYKLVV
ncbi:glycosyl hydrolases family 38 protein [Stylonychia lemnae]|uniref:Glycosyl hydrolases family 38 protein n=1 Tax=Stylonychia lemnae TaxID=5949 RepID=A0A078B6S9_STYLE|nr:glycosyl hydrolases family 38 protein [Stylonychia lemnae]|eukprot:CDW89891.1 glycosyl hydrolases family 38 protein [Stylonychia lemnae]